MPIRSFAGKNPLIAKSAYVDDLAVIIGDVVIGEESSIWPMTVIRGDINSIRIGNRTSIQDGTVIHVNHAGEYNQQGDSVIIGDNVTVGHQATLHGCTIGDHCLIGMGAIVMDAIIESEVIVGAGSLVPPGKILESGYLWVGSPVKKQRPLTEQERSFLQYSADYYVKLQKRYTTQATSLK